jgi:mRNA interferase MazF
MNTRVEPQITVERGQIYWLDWNPARGSEQGGRRPALIIQTDIANKKGHYPLTVVVAISSQGRPIPFHVEVEPTSENGLSRRSYLKCEQIMTVRKDRLAGKIGTVDSGTMEQVDQAIKQVLSLP